MKPSVTILLPIHNAQHRLERQVGEILDVLPELTNRFELMIIDDGSTDDSFDVARHLSVTYPQVSTMRHPARLGLAQAVRSGLEQTDGDLVLVGDEQHGMRPDDLRRLWHSYAPQAGGQEAEAASGSQPSGDPARWFSKMLSWKLKNKAEATGPMVVEVAQGAKRVESSPSVPGVTRRVDERQPAALGKPVVQPRYTPAGRRQQPETPATDRRVPGQSPIERSANHRGPSDRRRNS